MNRTILLVPALLLAACNGSSMGTSRASGTSGSGDDAASEGSGDVVTTGAGAAAGVRNTFDHPAAIGGAATTPREAMRRMEEEGPPAFSSRVHSCRKPRYGTLGRILRARGVDLDADDALAAGAMWRGADQALGAPNYEGRIGETTEMTVASSSRMFDIFVQAAPEIIAALPSRPECTVGGVGATLFDTAGRCDESGFTCLLGRPASEAHLTVCNDVVRRAPTPEQGRAIAVAALLSAVFTCE